MRSTPVVSSVVPTTVAGWPPRCSAQRLIVSWSVVACALPRCACPLRDLVVFFVVIVSLSLIRSNETKSKERTHLTRQPSRKTTGKCGSFRPAVWAALAVLTQFADFLYPVAL